MGSIVAEPKGAVVSSAGRLSACLSDAIRSPVVAVSGATPEGYDAPVHGADLREGRWEPPATITADMVVEANRWRQQHSERSGWVQPGVLKQWLAILITGSAKRQADDVDEAARLSALMFAIEEHPAYCFTKSTLREAQRRFKFLPTPAELLEFVDGIAAAERRTADRLWKIVETGVRTGAAVAGDTDAAMRLHREKTDRERRELAAILAERDAAQGKHAADDAAPVRQAGESDKAFVARLMNHAHRQISLGQAALRRDNRMRAREAKEATKAAYAATGIKVEPPADDTASETAQNTTSCGGGA